MNPTLQALNLAIRIAWLQVRPGTDTRQAARALANHFHTSLARIYGNLSYLQVTSQLILLTKQPGLTIIL